MIKLLLIFALLGVVMYLLYINGYMMLNSKKALTFIGSQRGKKASFTACNGWIRRVLRVKESRKYVFDLDLQLSKGEMQVVLLDEGKNEIAWLDESRRTASLELTAGKRYYLVFRFAKATGKYELKYE
ncbi:MAG: hypothetical protein IJN37_08320 [Clostridia bacterium]|nr:hypothetical protein [Clostridia bacterium]